MPRQNTTYDIISEVLLYGNPEYGIQFRIKYLGSNTQSICYELGLDRFHPSDAN